MKPKALVTILSVSLTACAVMPENWQAWEMKPVMDVRHGMANANAYFQLGRHQQGQGKLAAAEALYQKALAADPKHADALNGLGMLYAERGELERAADAFRRLAELAPQRAYLYNNVGYALHLQGRHAEAVDALRRAVALNPGYDRAWVNLQNAARKAGMHEVAALAARRELGGEPAVAVAAAKVRPGSILAAPAQPELALAPSATIAGGIEPVVEAGPAAPVVAAATVVRSRAITLREVPVRRVPADSQAPVASPPAGMIVFGHAAVPAAPVRVVPASMPAPQARMAAPKARIEVSNGNGINGFARRIRGQLEGDGVKVVRMTNYSSFAVRQTVIEYRQGFAAAAQALQAQLGKPAALAEARSDRPGTDVRLILGRDWWTPERRVVGAGPESPVVAEGGAASDDDA